MAELRTDIRAGDWVDRLAPLAFRPYIRLARLDRPIGTWLLLFPCWWGLFLALDKGHLAVAWEAPSQSWFVLGPVILFALGALVMRGAGCTYNDIVDRRFDARVARTALRPIPSGQVSVRQAVVFLAAQLLVGLLILLVFNRLTILLGVLSLVLVFTYPLMKRITYWPQAFLGLTFNWGVLMGWAAAMGGLHAPAFALYAVFLLIPLASIALLSVASFGFYTGIKAGFEFQNYAEVLGDEYFHAIFGRTFGIALATTALAALIGTPEAYILYRMRNPWKSLFLLLALGPLLISVVVRTLGWAMLFGSTGVVNQALIALKLIATP